MSVISRSAYSSSTPLLVSERCFSSRNCPRRSSVMLTACEAPPLWCASSSSWYSSHTRSNLPSLCPCSLMRSLSAAASSFGSSAVLHICTLLRSSSSAVATSFCIRQSIPRLLRHLAVSTSSLSLALISSATSRSPLASNNCPLSMCASADSWRIWASVTSTSRAPSTASPLSIRAITLSCVPSSAPRRAWRCSPRHPTLRETASVQ
mmetsp:Transcript_19507/g.49443  ORF Transcript_19507/g.49443 Transcript_19507/m.49443 type:complete len:207 (+) Transcript_19507:280-900(+)